MAQETKLRHLLSLILIVLFSQGCATLTQGSTQQITVTSTPTGANLVVNGLQSFRTPAVLDLARNESHQIEISLDGYHPETVQIRRVGSNMVAGNIIAGGLIGLAVDYSSGAAYRLVPEVVQVTLRPVTEEPSKNSLSAEASGSQAEEVKTD